MKIIDLNKLMNLYGSNDGAQDIIKMFIDQSEELLQSLESAIESNDHDALYNLCHKAIGQCRYIAADPLEQELTLLQNKSNTPKQNLNTIRNMIHQIRHDFS